MFETRNFRDPKFAWNQQNPLLSGRISIILASLCLFLLTYNLFILKSQPAEGYVINIYGLLPLQFYLILVFCYLSAGILLFNSKKIFASLILVLMHIVILMIPFTQGYYSMGRADDLTYIGLYLSIVKNGLMNAVDIYPASALIGASISLLTGLKVNVVSFLMPIHFSFMFILGMAIFLKGFLNPIESSIAVLSLFVYYFGHYQNSIAPHYLFFSMLPFLLYLLYSYAVKKNGMSIATALILFVLLVPFSHPFIVTFLVYFIVATLLCLRFTGGNSPDIFDPDSYLQKFFGVFNKLNIEGLKTTLLLLLTGFMCWFSYNDQLLKMFQQLCISFVDKATKTTAVDTADKLFKLDMGILEFLRFFTVYYGRYFLPLIFIILASYYVYRNKRQFSKEFLGKYQSFVILYVFLVFLEIIFFFNSLVSHEPDRLTNLNFVVFAQIPLVASALYALFLRDLSRKNLLKVLTILGVVWCFSFLGCFNSPHVYHTSDAITYNEVQGMKWLYGVKENYPINMMIEQPNRYHDIFGDYEPGTIDKPFKDPTFTVENHLGYDEYNVSQNRNFAQINMKFKHAYVVLSSVGELLYQEVPGYKRVGRFTGEDFNRFKNDPSVSQIYGSLNINIYHCTNDRS